jgi:nucleotide-binding universal stress UspA family protein
MHVIDLAGDERADESTVIACTSLLASESAVVRSISSELQCSTELVEGRMVRDLATASATASLLVVGSHKTGFIRGRVFGSRGLQLAAAAHSPVAIIPDSTHRHRAGIVVGLDDSPSAREALRFAAREAERRNEELKVLFALAPQDTLAAEHVDRIAGAVLEAGLELVASEFPSVSAQPRFVARSAAEALVGESASASLLVVGRPRGEETGGSILGSTTHDVILNLAGPTVVVEAPSNSDENSGLKSLSNHVRPEFYGISKLADR